MMEGSQFLPHTPPSSEEEDDGAREYGAVVMEDGEGDALLHEDADVEGEERYCVSCASVLGEKERGPRCIDCYREMRQEQEYNTKRGRLPSPETPRKLVRPKAIKEPASCFGKKRARLHKHVSDDEVDEPDLGSYFALFANFSEAEQVKYCRAYATMLAARSVKNRVRYSKDAGEKFAKKY